MKKVTGNTMFIVIGSLHVVCCLYEAIQGDLTGTFRCITISLLCYMMIKERKHNFNLMQTIQHLLNMKKS